jgi:hypothetical protein
LYKKKCCTSQGARLLTQWIKQPLVDLHQIEDRQNMVEMLINDTEMRQDVIENYLKRMPDFQVKDFFVLYLKNFKYFPKFLLFRNSSGDSSKRKQTYKTSTKFM